MHGILTFIYHRNHPTVGMQHVFVSKGPDFWNTPTCQQKTRWWFQIFAIFIPIWGRFPFGLIFFRWVETTKQKTFSSNLPPNNIFFSCPGRWGCHTQDVNNRDTTVDGESNLVWVCFVYWFGFGVIVLLWLVGWVLFVLVLFVLLTSVFFYTPYVSPFPKGNVQVPC